MSIFGPRNQQARPLGQSSAYHSGVLGDDAVLVPSSAPWMVYSAGTVTFQNSLNPLLTQKGYCALKADGILGPATCGAAKLLGLTPPASCKSFTTPALLTSGCAATATVAAAPAAKSPSAPLVVAPIAAPATHANLLLVGGAVVVGAGLLYYFAKKKGMV